MNLFLEGFVRKCEALFNCFEVLRMSYDATVLVLYLIKKIEAFSIRDSKG